MAVGTGLKGSRRAGGLRSEGSVKTGREDSTVGRLDEEARERIARSIERDGGEKSLDGANSRKVCLKCVVAAEEEARLLRAGMVDKTKGRQSPVDAQFRPCARLFQPAPPIQHGHSRPLTKGSAPPLHLTAAPTALSIIRCSAVRLKSGGTTSEKHLLDIARRRMEDIR